VLLAAGSLHAERAIARTNAAEAMLVVDAGNGAAYVLASASLEGRLDLGAALVEEARGDVRFLLPPAPR
jgi:hypothetical protein